MSQEVTNQGLQAQLAPLSEEEREKALRFAERVDLDDRQATLGYGASAQRKLAQFSADMLRGVQENDAALAGQELARMLAALEAFEAPSARQGFLAGLFSDDDSQQDWAQRYTRLEAQIDEQARALERQRIALLKQVALYERMADANAACDRELSMYLLAGETVLKRYAQPTADAQETARQFMKKLHDLRVSRQLAMQLAAQASLMRENSAQLSDQIQSCLAHAVPLWKNQMSLLLGLSAGQGSRSWGDDSKAAVNENNSTLRAALAEAAEVERRALTLRGEAAASLAQAEGSAP